MADDPSSTNPRWWSLAQTLVWIVLRIEMPPQDAEQITYSPEMNPESEGALNQLKGEFWKSALGVPKGVPVDKFRILCGRRYADLLTLFQVPSAEPGAQSTAIDLFERDVRWQDVECNSIWLKRTFPAPVAAESEETPVAATPPVSAADEETTPTVADASAPAANTEAAKPPESPQAVASEESPAPDKQLNDPAAGVQASVGAQRAPEQSEMQSKSPEPGRAEPTEQLTYAQIAAQLRCSPEAARALVARRHLPCVRGRDGKILVTINLQEIHYRPRSARSSDGDRLVTGRSPGGHHPVAEPEMASSPPGDATTAETPAANTAPPVSLDGRPTDRAQNILEQNTTTSSASAASSPTASQPEPGPPAAEPGVADPAPAASTAPLVNRGGCPTDRDPSPAAPAAVDEEAAQLPALPSGAKPKPKPKDQQLVLDVAGKLFPDGWESISTGVIHQQVNKNLLGRNLKAVSFATTGRALGRRRK